MSKVMPGRYTAHIEGQFAVFNIGMRVNKLWAVHKWLPVFLAMSPMLQELYSNQELGFLGASYFFSWRGVSIIQYWRTFEQLQQYASNGSLHLDAWRNFNHKVRKSGCVGIYHETYIVPDGQYKCVYNNMPRMGLAIAGDHIPAS